MYLPTRVPWRATGGQLYIVRCRCGGELMSLRFRRNACGINFANYRTVLDYHSDIRRRWPSENSCRWFTAILTEIDSDVAASEEEFWSETSVAKRVHSSWWIGNGILVIASRTELFPELWSPITTSYRYYSWVAGKSITEGLVERHIRNKSTYLGKI
jgi:hypothetical protein